MPSGNWQNPGWMASHRFHNPLVADIESKIDQKFRPFLLLLTNTPFAEVSFRMKCFGKFNLRD
jgi:hypothetical protein